MRMQRTQSAQAKPKLQLRDDRQGKRMSSNTAHAS